MKFYLNQFIFPEHSQVLLSILYVQMKNTFYKKKQVEISKEDSAQNKHKKFLHFENINVYYNSILFNFFSF